MPRSDYWEAGMRTARVIELTDEQRQQLQRLARSNTVSVRLARRAKMILLANAGLDNREIARELPGRYCMTTSVNSSSTRQLPPSLTRTTSPVSLLVLDSPAISKTAWLPLLNPLVICTDFPGCSLAM